MKSRHDFKSKNIHIIANTISLLMRTEADFINCSIIYCDGGEHRSGTF